MHDTCAAPCLNRKYACKYKNKEKKGEKIHSRMKYKWLQNNTKLPAIQIQFLPLFTLISVRIFYVICVTHCEKPNIYICWVVCVVTF